MSSIVIKVKFGETLRRFPAVVLNKKLDLDVVVLRNKIRGLFNFGPDVDFTLTYIDEDGDAVTLADDDDLCDVVRQSLNPLRINVSLKTDNLGGTSGSSTPPRPLQDQFPFQALNSGVLEIMKSVPEPLREAISKLSHDFALKATPSSPAFVELMEKMKMVQVNQGSDSMAVSRAQGASDVKGQPGAGAVESKAGGSKSKNKEKQLPKVTEGVKLKDAQQPVGVDLNVPYFEYENFQAPADATKGVKVSQVVSDISSTEKNKGPTDVDEKVSGKEFGSGSLSGFQEWKSTSFGGPDYDFAMQLHQDSKTRETGGSSSAEIPKPTNDPSNSSAWVQGMMNATNQCPFAGLPLPNDSDFSAYHHHSRSPHHRRGYHHGNGIGSIFHRGVRCDGCGVHPITGPRFKSKVKENYDLCSICLARMGNTADYIRLDRPASSRHSMPFKGFPNPSLRIPPPLLPHALRAPGSKLPRFKLDSRFILDVNVLDGTIMAPFTTFTKIWRMRNNGTIIWPHGSQLQWIGGDRLSDSVSVSVEIPAAGLPVDKELDIAVDFTAPELPGRYISYWRMASPSGQKFGQRVWVLIQVDASVKDLGETSINLNLPPVVKNHPEAVTQGPFLDSVPLENHFIRVLESENPFVDGQPKDQEMNFPINDTLIIGNGGSLYPPVGYVGSLFSFASEGEDAASVEPVYPTMDFPEVPPVAAQPPTVPVVQPPAAAAVEEVGDDREQALLRELKEMGFNQADLNKEILRMNKYDLATSVDHLCGVSEWDPMLEELQEMGFSDNEANRRLLKKNNGSIKRVVMDLINGEKP